LKLGLDSRIQPPGQRLATGVCTLSAASDLGIDPAWQQPHSTDCQHLTVIEATLSFLGMGAQPLGPVGGSILASGQAYLRLAPWGTIFPGVATLLTVVGIDLMGDVLWAALDARLKDQQPLSPANPGGVLAKSRRCQYNCARSHKRGIIIRRR
jgi:hypothetical protein